MMNKDEKYGKIAIIGAASQEVLNRAELMKFLEDELLGSMGIPAELIYAPPKLREEIDRRTSEMMLQEMDQIKEPELEPKAKSDSEEFLTRGQKREPKHQTHKRNYKFHR